MKKVILICLLCLGYYSNAQLWTPSQAWGNSFKRLAVTEGDTTSTKLAGALTVKSGVLYIANGSYWSMVTGGGGATDSLLFATWKRLYKAIDSLKAANNTWSGINTFNDNILLANLKSIKWGTNAIRGSSVSNRLYFDIAGSEVARFSEDGYLGLGVTTIDERLHVNGNIRLTGIIKQNYDTLATMAYVRLLAGDGKNIGNSNLTLTGNRSLDGVSTYYMAIDRVTNFRVSKINDFDIGTIGGDNMLHIDNAGTFQLLSTDGSGNFVDRVLMDAGSDINTFRLRENTVLKLDKAENASGAYHVLVKSDASDEVEKIADFSAAVNGLIDTTKYSTIDYVNYKDDLQQAFIDLRKLESDSTGSSGYTRRDRLQNEIDKIPSSTSTYTNKTMSGSNNSFSNIPNSALTNSSITVNGSAISLGGSISTITPSDTSVFARKAILLNYQTASYTLQNSDAGALVLMNVGSANTLTLPSSIPLGYTGTGTQYGAGETTLTAGAGVTLRISDGSTKTRVTYSSWTWIKISATEFLIAGDLK